MHTMIDIETVGTNFDACILTVAAQRFDPFRPIPYNELRSYYARVDLDSQPNRSVDQGTIEWWAEQPAESQQEAFGEDDRIDLKTVLEDLSKIIWQSDSVWANGPTFDMNILEHAYKSYGMPLPWKYYRVRDARTIYSLVPDLGKPPASHHALEDCRRQIDLLQQSLTALGVGKFA